MAFGAAGLICSPGTADPYGPKAMRAGMGAQFLVPVVTEVTAPDLWSAHLSRLEGVRRPAGAGAGRRSRGRRGLCKRSGRAERDRFWCSVRSGAAPETLGRAPARCHIPQDRFDSLNVAMAGTILLYELSARRGNQITGPLGL